MFLSRAQVRRVDQIAIQKLGVPGVVLMENAGRGCAEYILRQGVPERVVIACGMGNNAGDGYVIARHLRIAGVDVHVVASRQESLTGDAGINQAIWLASGEPVHLWDSSPRNVEDAAWIVDALLGTGASGPLRPPIDDMVAWMNRLPGRRLAVDLPTGLDCDTGAVQPLAFQADVTCTFVAAKIGFSKAPAEVLGTVEVIDIGAPRCAIEEALGESP